MMSGHGANPIFFNKKNKDWTSTQMEPPPSPGQDVTKIECLGGGGGGGTKSFARKGG